MGKDARRVRLPASCLLILVAGSAQAQTIQYNYGPSPAHAPTYDSFYNYAYDRNGNLTQITDRFTGAVKQRLEYNALNKLLRATAGSSVTDYRYDASGNRIEKVGPAGTEKYYGLIEAKGSTKTYYYFLGNRRVAQRTIGGNLYFHHQDHLGSASVLTNQNGVVQSRTSYHEFGSIKWQEGQGGITDYTYNDKRWDKETNFYDYGARAYSAKMFKFMTPDSIIPDPNNPQSLNRYAYVQNNPLKYIDPNGHEPVPAAVPIDYRSKYTGFVFTDHNQSMWAGMLFRARTRDAPTLVTVDTHNDIVLQRDWHQNVLPLLQHGNLKEFINQTSLAGWILGLHESGLDVIKENHVFVSPQPPRTKNWELLPHFKYVIAGVDSLPAIKGPVWFDVDLDFLDSADHNRRASYQCDTYIGARMKIDDLLRSVDKAYGKQIVGVSVARSPEYLNTYWAAGAEAYFVKSAQKYPWGRGLWNIEAFDENRQPTEIRYDGDIKGRDIIRERP